MFKDRLKNFIKGYGKSLDLFPYRGSIDDDWKIIGNDLKVAIKKLPKMSDEEKAIYKKQKKIND